MVRACSYCSRKLNNNDIAWFNGRIRAHDDWAVELYKHVIYEFGISELWVCVDYALELDTGVIN